MTRMSFYAQSARSQRLARRSSYARAARPWVLLAFVLSAPLLCARVEAQDARAREAAANAFDRGTEAYLAEDYDGAARWFERAYDMAPAAPAIYQAIRSHLRSEHERRAAELMARLVAHYPESGEASRVAPLLEEIAARYTRVEVRCDQECVIEVDDAVVGDPLFMLDEGRHVVRATFDTGPVERVVEAVAGASRTLEITAPPPVESDATPPRDTTTSEATSGTTGSATEGSAEVSRRDATRQRAPDDDAGSGVHPAAFGTFLALAAGAGGTLTWSGLDVLSRNDEYVASVDRGDLALARQQLADGQDAELRTNILIGVTAGLGATAVLLAIFTDWGGDAEDDADALRPQLILSPAGALAGVTGHFGGAE